MQIIATGYLSLYLQPAFFQSSYKFLTDTIIVEIILSIVIFSSKKINANSIVKIVLLLSIGVTLLTSPN